MNCRLILFISYAVVKNKVSLDILRIENFVSLKKLMLTEQIKKRIAIEIKEHFANIWEYFNLATENRCRF